MITNTPAPTFSLVLPTGAQVRLNVHPADEAAVTAAAKDLIAKGLGGWIAKASGPENLVMVRPFGDVVGTFEAARARAKARQSGSGNQMMRTIRGGR